MTRKNRRPHPLKYSVAERERLGELIRQHGAAGTREICSRTISKPTLLKIAKELGIELKQGRRRRKAA